VPSSDSQTPDLDLWLHHLQQQVDQADPFKVILSKPQRFSDDHDATLKRIDIRPVMLREGRHLSFVYHHTTQDITQNWLASEGVQRLTQTLREGRFKQAHLQTAGEEWQLQLSKRGKTLLVRHALQNRAEPAPTQGLEHNRSKHRWVEEDRPYLQALGIMDSQLHLIPAMARKWKQINKFIEILDRTLHASGLTSEPRVRVMDFGSGKGYLTFAVHDHLHHRLKCDAHVTGIELRPELVKLCNQVAQQLDCVGLDFEAGDIRAKTVTQVDVMVALHACDIATDLAIYQGIQAGARVLICSPCCHKELRPQLLSPHPIRSILQFGIHQHQEAEMITDGLRALMLQACGYETNVFEFISLEHTSKNKMILALRQPDQKVSNEQTQRLCKEIQEIKAFYGIQTQALEQLLWPQAIDANQVPALCG
jgi:2-polyprenyl-3-methyl-5-hydroxy-6-metoxy-1,4-benzoquinol methylase